MLWKYQTQPTIEPVSYAELKAQLRIDNDDERALMMTYISAARIYAETECQQTLISRQIILTRYTNEPPNQWVPLPRGPVISIDTVKDSKGNVINPSYYELRRVGGLDFLFYSSIVWPPTVTYTAGYGSTATDVPADIRLGILLHSAYLWGNREAAIVTRNHSDPIAFGLDTIYGSYKPRGTIG